MLLGQIHNAGCCDPIWIIGAVRRAFLQHYRSTARGHHIACQFFHEGLSSSHVHISDCRVGVDRLTDSYRVRIYLIGAGVAGIVLGSTSSVIFLLPAALMAFLPGAVLIVRPDIDVGLTALAATLFCGGYLVGVIITNTRPRLFTRPLRDK
jgi:hypothetical protein